MLDKRKFWVVWNPQGGPPRFKHHSEEDAVRESMRLAASHPSEEFIVMESVGTAKKVEATFNRHKDSRLQMPF